MSLILNIDTASEKAHVSFADDGIILHCLWNESQKDHASFLQSGILQLTKTSGIKLSDIDAVALTAGPGSYTGLRVGMASAKGLCYALKKPLITMNTLEVLTLSAIHLFPGNDNPTLLCPMIDARRMEVYSALYNPQGEPVSDVRAVVVDENSFAEFLQNQKIIFFGNGSSKCKDVIKNKNAIFIDIFIFLLLTFR